jgi:phage I-like protein
MPPLPETSKPKMNNSIRASPLEATTEKNWAVLDAAQITNLATLETLPTEIPLHPFGKFKGNGKDFYCDKESLKLCSKEKANGVDWILDIEHDAFYQDFPEANPLNMELSPKEFVLVESVRTAGWITGLMVKDGYVYGQVQWTPNVTEDVLNGVHRYVSPVLLYADDGQVIGYHSFALVKRPGTTNQRRIGLKEDPNVNKQPLSLTVRDIEDDARRQLRLKLQKYVYIADILNDSIVFGGDDPGLYQVSYTVNGTKLILGDDITKVVRSYTPKEEEAMNKAQLAALAAKLNMPFETEDDEKKLMAEIERLKGLETAILSATGAASGDAAVGAIEGLKQNQTQTETLAAKVAAMEKQKEDDEKTALIEKLSAEGKLAPAHLEKAKTKSLAELKSFAEFAMPLVNLGAKEKEPAMQRDALMTLREAMNSQGPGKQQRILKVYHEILAAHKKGDLNMAALAGPAAGGTPLLSEATIWSARTLEQLDKEFVYVRAFTNRDYEADARRGGTVNMYYFSSIGVTNYTGAWADAAWADLDDNEVVLQIDQAKKVIFKVPRVRQQFNQIDLLEQGTSRAAQDIGDVVDQFIAAVHADIAAGNVFGTTASPITVGFGAGQTKPVLALARLNQALVAARAPRMGRKAVVVPDWFGTMLLTELGARATQLGDNVTQNGENMQGMIFRNVAGFDEVHVSVNVPNTAGTLYKVIAGGQAVAFAMGIEDQEILSLQNDFGQGYKGLYVYGKKLPRGEYMASGTWNIGAYQA